MFSLFLKIKKEQNIRDKIIDFFKYCISKLKIINFLK